MSKEKETHDKICRRTIKPNSEKSYDHDAGLEHTTADKIDKKKEGELRKEALDIINDSKEWAVFGVVEKDGKYSFHQSVNAAYYKHIFANVFYNYLGECVESLIKQLELLSETYPDNNS